jgi:aminopeptidase N
MTLYDDLRSKVRKIDGFSQAGEKHYTPSLQVEPIHQKISLQFDLPKKTAHGSVETTIKANVAGIHQLKFDAIDLTIDTITGVDTWHYDGNKITLLWSTPFSKDETRLFEIKYSLEDPITGMYFSYPDEAYPKRSIYAVTDNESERARYWLPCIDHLSVRCSIDFFLTAPQQYTLLANGNLFEESVADNGEKTAHWHQSFPCPSYLITLAVGEFIESKDDHGDAGKGPIPVANYTTTNFTVEDLKRSFSGTPEFLAWMREKWQCPLEWDKYYQIATASHGGAMENISLVAWGDFSILDENEAKELKFLIDDINVHEMSHSWFGDMIVCKEFSHAWLKESWATYVEALYYEDTEGRDLFLDFLYHDAKSYMGESDERYARPIVTPDYDSSWDMYDNHLYPGGAWRIHMLRKKLGDEIFFPAVQDYLNTFKGKVVETVDFQRKLEIHSGLNLQAFFDQWLHSAGYPKLEAEFTFDDKNHLGSLKITQTQVDDKKKIGLFKFPLDIEWETAAGTFERKTFQITAKEQSFYFSAEKKPVQIRLDPDVKVLFALKFNPGDKMLQRELSSEIFGANGYEKIRAAQELAKTGTKKNLLAIKEAYLSATFWGLKIEYAKAIAQASNSVAEIMLIDLLAGETDPMVLESFIGALDGWRSEHVFKALQAFVKRPEPLYWALSAALKGIGAQRTSEAYEFLTAFTIPYDYKAIVRLGWYQAIGKTRDNRAVNFLLNELPYGKAPERIRGKLIQALGESLTWAEPSVKSRTLERFGDILRAERDEKVLYGLVKALAQINEPAGASLLEEARGKFSLQDQPRINRAIKKLQKGPTPGDQKKIAEKDWDDMKKLVKKLNARVETLEALVKKDSE